MPVYPVEVVCLSYSCCVDMFIGLYHNVLHLKINKQIHEKQTEQNKSIWQNMFLETLLVFTNCVCRMNRVSQCQNQNPLCRTCKTFLLIFFFLFGKGDLNRDPLPRWFSHCAQMYEVSELCHLHRVRRQSLFILAAAEGQSAQLCHDEEDDEQPQINGVSKG